MDGSPDSYTAGRSIGIEPDYHGGNLTVNVDIIVRNRLVRAVIHVAPERLQEMIDAAVAQLDGRPRKDGAGGMTLCEQSTWPGFSWKTALENLVFAWSAVVRGAGEEVPETIYNYTCELMDLLRDDEQCAADIHTALSAAVARAKQRKLESGNASS